VTTFKQLEAFVTVVDLGSFEKAAKSLETSQSNVSRQIASFEASFDVPLFNRDQRSARLTMTGQEVLQLARGLLRQRSNLTERFANPDIISSTLRLGVTELAAMTWLGGFIAELRRRYPRMRLEPVVGSSAFLHSRVRDGQLDIAIVLSAVRTTEMARLPIGQSHFGWYCASALPISGELNLAEFERETLLLQGNVQSGGSIVGQWLQERSVHPASSIPIDSLSALAGMCAAGLGVAGMPNAVAQGPLRQGLLRQIEIPIGAPKMDYIALVRIDAISDLHRSVAALAQSQCDFATPFHGQ
jgi:DNA-binding transcriptional LysR family regulator